MSDFSAIIEDTLENEGGLLTWTNRAGDAGGETVGGVSRVHHGELEWWAALDTVKNAVPYLFVGEGPVDLEEDASNYAESLIETVREGILAFYRSQGQLTRSVHVEDIDSQSVATKLFDIKINGGAGMLKPCVKALQDAMVMSVVDGIIGPNTLDILNRFYTELEFELVGVLGKRQAEYYARIVRRDPGQAVNLLGWTRRAWKGIA